MFIGPFEHHSNELPWRESIADVVVIPEDRDGHIDLGGPRGASCSEYADRPLRIGSFSAASNVTGIVTDTRRDRRPAAPPRRAVVLGLRRRRAVRRHRHDPDCDGTRALQGRGVHLARTSSSAGPARPACSSCAASCCATGCPTVPGGGTVAYVNPTRAPLPRRPGAPRGGRHPGDRRVDPRRAGVPAQGGRRRRRDPGARGATSCGARSTAWRRNPTIEILGNLDAERLSIVSFVVRRPGGRVPAPQLRRGAAQRPVRHPVARRLLVRRPVRAPAARHRPRALARVRARDRRTAARASSPAGCGSASTTSSPRRCSEYIVDAVDLVADHGWRLLPRVPLRSGHRPVAAPRTGRSSRRCGSAEVALRPTTGALAYPRHDEPAPESALAGYLDGGAARCSTAAGR